MPNDAIGAGQTDDLAERRKTREAAEAFKAVVAAFAERAYARYIRPESAEDIETNQLSSLWLNYAIPQFTDVCPVHGDIEGLNRFLRFGQVAFFAGVLAEREGLKAPK